VPRSWFIWFSHEPILRHLADYGLNRAVAPVTIEAHRFSSEEGARRAAATMQTNSAVREYIVVPLTPRRAH
jgi:hypothetical protein